MINAIARQDVRLRDALGQSFPELSVEESERRVRLAVRNLHSYHHYSQAPALQRVEEATTDVWWDLSPESAATYVEVMLSLLRASHGSEPKSAAVATQLERPVLFGEYLADRVLGAGGDGYAFHARHQDTRAEVTVKQPARGDGFALLYLGSHWHPNLVRVLDGEPLVAPNVGMAWVIREFGDESLHDVMQRSGPLRLGEALALFATCCQVVAWLHARHVYRWSAHAKNVLRFGDAWKIVDLGRCLIFVPENHWSSVRNRETTKRLLGERADALEPALLDWLGSHLRSGHPTASGFVVHDQERERRLRMDDCAMLGGLLAVLLSGKRWPWYFRGLNKQPYFSARYTLLDDRNTDAQLSAVLNRAWRGDAGGAPLMANGGRGEQTTYDNALELLADLEAVLANTGLSLVAR